MVTAGLREGTGLLLVLGFCGVLLNSGASVHAPTTQTQEPGQHGPRRAGFEPGASADPR